jgi:DNA-binding response OmpR family regulator
MARILVVDDDRDLRNLVDFRLRKAGHEVLTAGDAADALVIVQARGAPDLAILDVVMPGMSGLELLRALRRREGLAKLPAIFLSARILPADIAAGRKLGAAYLTKPFVAPALLAAVTAALDAGVEDRAPAPAPAPARPAPARPLPAGRPLVIEGLRPVAPAASRTSTSRPPPDS